MNEETTDLTLIENIQNNKKQEDSLNALVERHSGIYLEMVNSYASPNSPFIDYNDLVNDKEYKIYSAAIKFDKTKGAKFSTYLGNETKWMCLNIYNKNKRRPTWHSDYLENIPESPDFQCDPMSANVKKDLLNKVLNVIDEHPDKRVKRIFNMRYIIGHKNKVMSWKKIGIVMKLSIQGCINIHNSAINSFKEQLKEEV